MFVALLRELAINVERDLNQDTNSLTFIVVNAMPAPIGWLKWLTLFGRFYMDESCIHHYYSRHNDSLFDPFDLHYDVPNTRHKGKRFCFIVAIHVQGKSACLMRSLDIFEGDSAQNQIKDYHGMFHHGYFVRSMQQLVDELDEKGVVNALNDMDNSFYHTSKSDGTLIAPNRKAVL